MPLPKSAPPINRRDLRQQRVDARERFRRTRNAERGFSAHLRRVAKHVGHVVTGIAPDGHVGERELQAIRTSLDRYAELLRPWARAVSERMVAEVNQRDAQAWRRLGRSVGAELGEEIGKANIRTVFGEMLEEQIELITSLPSRASERVHRLVINATLEGKRADQIAAEIMRTGRVSESDAMRIARTETSRTASAIVEARALSVGSVGYVWRTAEDNDVRASHKRLNGKIFRWDEPPVAGDSGERAHPGGIYNCRCYPEPLLPKQL